MYLDQLVQLHERVEIYYTVSPQYKATLYTREGDVFIADANGETIQEALDNLNKVVESKGWTLEQIRKKH